MNQENEQFVSYPQGEEITENQELTSKKQDLTPIRDEKGRIISGTANPNGRPKNALSFATKWRQAIDKIAKSNNTTAEEIEMQLLLAGYKKAKEGDLGFYKDTFDRVYGKANQTIDIVADVTNTNLSPEHQEKLARLLDNDTPSD